MKYVNLGRSGLKVSRLCLGCMSYGEPERLPQPWSLDEKASRPLIRQALEAGINFFDTANIYSGGSSEEITGKALREMARRDEIVVATKTFFPWRNSPNTGFLSRKAIFQSIDDSLMRLGMDYVDLFQIHRFDYSTPVEETMEALHDVVKAGKARYIGASSMEAWRFAKMQHTAERNGWTRFITMLRTMESCRSGVSLNTRPVATSTNSRLLFRSNTIPSSTSDACETLKYGWASTV